MTAVVILNVVLVTLVVAAVVSLLGGAIATDRGASPLRLRRTRPRRSEGAHTARRVQGRLSDLPG